MRLRSLIKPVKVALAAILLCGILLLAGRDLAPTVPVATLLLYCVVAAAVILGLLIACVVFSLSIGQFALRKGGTDAQWFWFSSEPKGLLDLRARAGRSEHVR